MTVDVISTADLETGLARDFSLARVLDWYVQKGDVSPEETMLLRWRFDEAQPVDMGQGVEAFKRMSWNSRMQAVVFSIVFPIQEGPTREGIVGVASYWTDELEISPEREAQIYEVLRSVRATVDAQQLAAVRPQSHMPPVRTYTTFDGFLTVDYPVEWEVYGEQLPTDMGPLNGMPMIVASNYSLLADLPPDVEFPDDGVALVILLMPNYFPEPGMEFMQLNAEGWTRLMAVGAAQDSSVVEVSEVEAVTLASGATAYHVRMSEGSPVVNIYTVQLEERVVLFVMLMTSPTFDAPLPYALALDVIDSARFSGQTEEFLAHVEEEIERRR
jgi:hypothetical protein